MDWRKYKKKHLNLNVGTIREQKNNKRKNKKFKAEKRARKINK